MNHEKEANLPDPEYVDDEDVLAIGDKILEMADRVKVMHAACPGTVASWAFEMDGQRFAVRVSVANELSERPE